MAKKAQLQTDYAALSKELADLLANLEQGELTIDAAVAAYERGLAIVAELESYLSQAENRVAELKAV